MFFSDADYELYRDLGQQCLEHGVAVWSCCLMPDHVHLIFVPDRAEARSARLPGRIRDPDGERSETGKERAKAGGQ